MTGKDSRAFQFYQKVFENHQNVTQSEGEEATMFIFHHYKDRRGPRWALDFLKKALKSYPECHNMLTWERRLMEELGIIHYKSESRWQESPKREDKPKWRNLTPQATRVILSGFSPSNCTEKEKTGLPDLPIKGP
jgi:hypothetical protein